MNALRKKDLLTLVACAVLFAVMQGLMMAEIIGPFWELNIVLICINIILSVSLNLINGYTGQFSIGHAGFLAVGAYTGAIVTVKLGFSYELALIAGTVAAGFLGFLIGLPTLRLNGDYLAIATLGLGEIIRICILNIDYGYRHYEIQSYGVYAGGCFCRHCRRIVLALLLYCTSGILYFHAFFRYSDHGRFRRPGLDDRRYYRRCAADFYFCLSGRIS